MSAEETIEKAIDAANTGDPLAGTRMLWPHVPEEDHRDEALFALAFCFEKATNFATAHYLYGKVIELYPDFEPAKKREEKCREVVEERGLIEDFADMGHRECMCCRLRYRAEYMLCPYCGVPKDTEKPYKEVSALSDEDLTKKEWKDPSVIESLGEMGRDAADKVQEFVESDTVKDISNKIKVASASTAEKAKGLADKQKLKEVSDRGAEVGKEVIGKAEQLTKSQGLRDVAKKIEDISWQASDAVKGMVTGKKVERNQTDESGEPREAEDDFVEQAKNVGKNILRSIRDAIDPDKDKNDPKP